MRIVYMDIKKFKNINSMEIKDISNALILVGQNSTGKSTILDAIRAVTGDYEVRPEDFDNSGANIEIKMRLYMNDDDLRALQRAGKISEYRKYDAWKEEFMKTFPSYSNKALSFTFIANTNGTVRYDDGFSKNNKKIKNILPTVYFIDSERKLTQFQNNMLILQENDDLKKMRSNSCIFNDAKTCNHCFSCIGLINQKKPSDLSAYESAKLLEYKLYNLNLESFAKKVNEKYKNNGGLDEILFSMNRDVESMLSVTTELYSQAGNVTRPIERLGKGMRSIYMLSLLETYTEKEKTENCILLMEDVEIFLHPTMQKTTGDILYRLSKKHQVIFTTHSPNLLSNFHTKQIRQLVLDANGFPTIRSNIDISEILYDLGYTANDFMNVDFVFIVEGRQDKSRLPLLLKKYYSEVNDKNGELKRISIITTNSCTNIKTYANLKYMNQVYLRDRFLMIRDGDGKDAKMLKRQLCNYYDEQNARDVDHLPRVREENVLILKYYSFENYFLNPSIMAKLGIVESEEKFYEIFLQKWKEYLFKLSSARHLVDKIGKNIETVEDVKENMEEIKICLRGHNLYDIFYGRYKKDEKNILSKYIRMAPREEFADILDAIDRFMFFESKRQL